MTSFKRLLLPLALLLALGGVTLSPHVARWVQATVNEVTARNDYTANGSTTAFTYTWRILTKSDIEVLVNGVVKTVDTDYTVSGLGASGGGTVTFLVAPANGLKVALLRKQPAQQTSVYLPNTAISATRLEQDLDKLQMQVQQLKEQLQRIPAFEKKSLLKDKTLPDFGADKFLHVTADGLTLEWVSPVTVGTLNVPAFTTGSVPFATGPATLGQDNANLFWDDGNNRLGIGTATPSTQLHAVGNTTLGGTLAVTGASTLTGAVSTAGTLSSTKACAAGYTRVGPNFCKANIRNTGLWTDATACTARNTAGNTLPADAKAAYIVLDWVALSNNATGLRTNNVNFYNDAACSAAQRYVILTYSEREEVAVAAGTTLSFASIPIIVPLTGTDTFHTTQLNAGGNGNAEVNEVSVIGYFD